MRRATLAALCASALVPGALPSIARAQTNLAGRFQSLLLARYAAIARADTAALRPQLADDLRWVIGANGAEVTKPQFLAAVAQPQVPAPRFEVDSVHAQRTGDIAIVEYRRADHRAVGTFEETLWTRALEIFVWLGGQWQLERHTQAWLVTPVRPVTLDSAALQAFVGRYQIAPSYVDDVHWEANRLVATASGQATGAVLVPVSATAFSPDSVGALMVFERDASGRVLGYVQGFPDGSVRRAARIP
ncbi:MAG TPA: nuclear transport factor 2 family protein [bacterium]|nr:nuclear transport factor 2 family protein [bacterium]